MTTKLKNQTPIRSDFVALIPGVHMQAEFRTFAEWYGTPGQFRSPETQKEFATEIGVNQDTLTDWKRRPEFGQLVFRALTEWVKERVPDAIGGLYLKASSEKASARDVEVFLRLGGLDVINPNPKKK